MLIDPSGVSARRMDDAKDRIRAEEVPRIHRCATRLGISHQLPPIDRSNAALGRPGARRSTIQLGIVNVDALVVIGGGSGG